jgi:hypothetical protein
MARVVNLICPTAKAKYFWLGDWKTQITLNRLSKSQFWRTRFPTLGSRRVGKGATAPCPPFIDSLTLNGGHAEFIIGRAFARPVGFAHPTALDHPLGGLNGCTIS